MRGARSRMRAILVEAPVVVLFADKTTSRPDAAKTVRALGEAVVERALVLPQGTQNSTISHDVLIDQIALESGVSCG